MNLRNILSHYSNLAERNPQLNAATFEEMKSRLIKRCEELKLYDIKPNMERICNSYMRMRGGCEINSQTIKDAIRELNNYLSLRKL